MPELPEVLTIVRKLQAVVGLYINKFSWNTQVNRYHEEIQPNIGKILFPAQIERVWHHGKQIFFQILAKNYQRWIFNSFLAMTGRWSWTSEKHEMIRFELIQRVHQANSLSSSSLIVNPNGSISLNFLWNNSVHEWAPATIPLLSFSDQRRFGHFYIFRPEELAERLSKLGPDLYQERDKITKELWQSRFTEYLSRHSEHHICQALMEQSLFAGIGNYLKAEILYQSRIRPDRLLNQITLDELEQLRINTLDIIERSVQAGGLTISDYWDPDGKKGTFQKVIYDEKTDPNGFEIIRTETKDGRTTHWCPTIQK